MTDYLARSAMLCKTHPTTTPVTKTRKISSARDNEKCQNRKVMVTTSVFCKVNSATMSSNPRPVKIRSLMWVLERICTALYNVCDWPGKSSNALLAHGAVDPAFILAEAITPG